MPEVQTATSTIFATGKVEAATPSHIVMASEVEAACQAIIQASKLGKQARQADQERDQKLMVVFEKVLGVKTLDEVKAIGPEQMAALLQQRLTTHTFEVETGTDFDLKHKGEKRSPAWKELFVAAQGQAAADKALADTAPSHQWHIVAKKVVVQKQ